MSFPPSETSTLLASPPPDVDLDDDNPNVDVPIQVDSFLQHVRRGKLYLGPSLLLALATEALCTWLVFADDDGGGGIEGVVLGEKIISAAGVATLVVLCFIFALSLFRPIARGISRLYPLQHSKLHRALCYTTFYCTLLLLLLHPVPWIAHLIVTHQTPPPVSNDVFYARCIRSACLLLAMIAAGSIRRGPQLHAHRMKIPTGFGINQETEPIPSIKLNGSDAPEDVSETRREPDQNVFDYTNSSLLNFVFLTYLSGLVHRSLEVDQLNINDLPELESNIRNSGVDADLTAHHIALDHKVTQWSLLKSVWGPRVHVIYMSLFLESVKTSLSFLRVVALHEIVVACSRPVGWDKSYAYLMCGFLAAGRFVEDFLTAYLCVRESYLLHMPVRITIGSMLFAKILRSTDAKAMEAHHTIGETDDSSTKGRSQVMNLMTIDAGTIASLATKTWDLTSALLSLVVATYYLYNMLGVSAFVGIACIPLATPVSWIVSKAIYRCDKKLAAARDARTSAFKEYLVSVKVIKLNALDEHYERRVVLLRRNEVYWQRWRYTLGTVFNVLASVMPITNLIVTFAFHTKVMGRPLDPSIGFVAATVLYRVKDALDQVPSVINKIFETKVALGRIVGYLNQPEIVHPEEQDTVQDIVVTRATITWPRAENVTLPTETQAFCLRDVDLQVPSGKLTLICGALGTGKTLLLRALLGEATLLSGEIQAPHTSPDAVPATGAETEGNWSIDTWLTDSIAYAPQQSYIRHGTVRDNILFGAPMWRTRYEEVLRRASLLPDLELLGEHDLTEIGEYGVNLSGGQKARINLARCLYSRAKTIYLDDILSAVDAHTAQFLVDECLRSRLLRNRTCVLVTHQVELCLPVADYVVLLKDGRIDRACPASDIDQSDMPHPKPLLESPLPQPDARQKEGGWRSSEGVPSRHIYSNERRELGRVASSHYWLIINAVGGWQYWSLLFAFLIGYRVVDFIQLVMLRRWTADPDMSHLDGHLAAYGGSMVLLIFIEGAKWMWLYGIGNTGFTGRMCQVIHDLLLERLVRAPLGWYESTPAGRIMNVVGYDMWNIDAVTPDAFGRSLMMALQYGMYLGTICIETPVVVLVILALAVPLWIIGDRLTKLRADLKRLSATSSSPLISVYHDAIDGVIMIRAFGAVELMKSTALTFLNRERKTAQTDWSVYNWVRAIILGASSIIVSATAFALVHQEVSGSQAGFVLVFAVSLSSGMFGMLQQYSELDRNFVHAERINQYIQMPDQEPEGGVVPAPEWPSRGEVKITDLCVRYAEDLPEVLHHVSLEIEPGMRVGLVGATGSGKSTLALSLFRGIDPHQGKVEIDGTDIATVDLKELRGRLNMVVQDGSLSSGTLRDALDVTGLKDDREIYEALRRVHLLPDPSDPSLADCPFANLDTFVAVEGANFSQGQRQLLCLARALLKQSKILVMDEATSSVDFEMDAKITQTIKECFAGTTMLVIAHRLATIMHYDRVAVLDRGKVVEYAAPLELMQRRDSAFRRLCMAQGEQEFDKLLAMAQGRDLLA